MLQSVPPLLSRVEMTCIGALLQQSSDLIDVLLHILKVVLL